MRFDEDAKLIFSGKKHVNFYNKRTNRGKEREPIEISKAFEGFLRAYDLLDKDNLERHIRKKFERKRDNSLSATRSESKSRS